MTWRLLPSLVLGLLLGLGPARAGLDLPPAPAPAPDLSAYATTQSVSSMIPAAVAAALAQQSTKQSNIPTTGPGAGLCRLTVVPSNIVSAGGVAGTAGTCSRIVQCGTDPTPVVTQFNIGGGC